MSSVKVLLKLNKGNRSNEFPLYIRIIKDRKTKFISLGIYLKEEQWDEKSSRVKKHANATRMNSLIAQKISEAMGVAVEMETKNKFVSSQKIKSKIMGKSSVSFTDYSRAYLAQLLKTDKIGTHDKVKAVLSKLEQYTKGRDVRFVDIDLQFLKDYENYLIFDLKNGTNTIHSNLKIFRKLFNDAIREELIEPDQNPFLRYKLKWEKTEKNYLTDEEIQRIEDLELEEGTMLFHHRNAYIFAAYAGGLRISDILQLAWSHFDGTHITKIMQKTNDIVSIKLPSKALEIISYYKSLAQSKDEFIFPFLNNAVDYNPESMFKAISSRTAYANKDLHKIAQKAEITKNISFHTSRHSWATRALKKGMRIEYVSKLMGHSSIKTTQIYSKIVNSELDKAMDVFE